MPKEKGETGRMASPAATVASTMNHRARPMPPHREIWLKSNRRVLLAAAIAPALLFILGVLIAMDVVVEAPTVARVFAGVLALAGAMLLGVLTWYARVPKLAYDGRNLLVYLRPGAPVRVPIEVVECFFLGSGLQPLAAGNGREVQIAHVAVRLAERAREWTEMEVKPALGKWCGGYITIYGAWCEPLSRDLVNRMNERLAAAHVAQREPSHVGSMK